MTPTAFTERASDGADYLFVPTETWGTPETNAWQVARDGQRIGEIVPLETVETCLVASSRNGHVALVEHFGVARTALDHLVSYG